jgi:hypothetical protein
LRYYRTFLMRDLAATGHVIAPPEGAVPPRSLGLSASPVQ